jgi:hypothetical protein
MSAEKMFRNNPRVYFWTFTFKAVLRDEMAAIYFQSFMKELRNYFPTATGLRVVEVHPSFYSHGLHYHCLLNQRMSWHIIKRIGKRFGITGIHVKRADKESAFYLAKYITKEQNLSKGMRKWGTIGGFHAVKVSQIQVDSQLTSNIKIIQEMINLRQFTYAFFLYIGKQTLRYGEISDWPTTEKITAYHAKIEKVCDIEKHVAVADDDGINECQNPIESAVSRLVPIRFKTSDGWQTHFVPVKPERIPF